MLNLNNTLVNHDQNICSPNLFYADKPNDIEKLNALIQEKPFIKSIDEIDGQLLELLKLRSPSIKYTKAELDNAVLEYWMDTNS